MVEKCVMCESNIGEDVEHLLVACGVWRIWDGPVGTGRDELSRIVVAGDI